MGDNTKINSWNGGGYISKERDGYDLTEIYAAEVQDSQTLGKNGSYFNGAMSVPISRGPKIRPGIDLISNLLSFYQFTNNLNDSSDSGYDMVPTGTQYDIGRNGNPALIGGSGIVDIPSNTVLTSGVTIAMWCLFSSLDATSSYSFSGIGLNGTESLGIAMSRANRRLFYSFNGGFSNYHYTVSAANLDKWFHFAVTHDGVAAAKAYVNGVKLYDEEALGALDDNAFNQIKVTSNVNKNYIDELGIWTRVLSDADIQSLYANGMVKL